VFLKATTFVMPGLVPGIHVLRSMWLGVDGRDEPGHDGGETYVPGFSTSHSLRNTCPSVSLASARKRLAPLET